MNHSFLKISKILLIFLSIADITLAKEIKPRNESSEVSKLILEQNILNIQIALESGHISSQQLVEFYISRIHSYDKNGPRLNSIANLNPHAMMRARQLDRERQIFGARGPLHGIPIVIKDNYTSKNMPTTGGSILLAEWTPLTDSYQVKKLKKAGAIILAKTNMDEFATGTIGSGSFYGQILNPHNLGFNPGGSSGGTGVAVSANFAAAGMGSDTCGSIRIPASFNNLLGIRGTQGLSSRAGIIPLSSTQDMAGPIAKSVLDLAILLDATVGYDPKDPQTKNSLGHTPVSYLRSLQKIQETLIGKRRPLAGIRIGILKDISIEAVEKNLKNLGDLEVHQILLRSVKQLEYLGAQAEMVDIPKIRQLLSDRKKGHLVIAYDYRQDFEDFFKLYSNAPIRSLTDVLDAEESIFPNALRSIKSSLAMGSRVSNEYKQAINSRSLIKSAIYQTMGQNHIDFFLYPTTDKKPARIGKVQHGNNCLISAKSGLPALSFPAGFSVEGLPIGMELLGREWSEERLLKIGYIYEYTSKNRKISPLVLKKD